MTARYWIARVLVIVCVGMTPAGAQTRGELIDRTMAIVGGRAVTLSDVQTARALGLVDAAADLESATARLVERALMLREVERYAPPEPGDHEVTQRIEELRNRFTAERLDRLLADGGFSGARLRAWLRDDLRIAAYLDQRFSAAVQIAVEQAAPELRARQAAERRQSLISDWINDLRRRTPVVELWRQ